MNIDEKTAPPELGTPEAAVQSCVTLLSMLFSQPEAHVAYYLDLYFQVRCMYESEKKRRLERTRDLYDVIIGGFQTMNDPPRPSAPYREREAEANGADESAPP